MTGRTIFCQFHLSKQEKHNRDNVRSGLNSLCRPTWTSCMKYRYLYVLQEKYCIIYVINSRKMGIPSIQAKNWQCILFMTKSNNVLGISRQSELSHRPFWAKILWKHSCQNETQIQYLRKASEEHYSYFPASPFNSLSRNWVNLSQRVIWYI